MQIVVCCNEEQKRELTATGLNEQARVVWVFEKVDLLHYKSADAVVDLLYENNNVNNALLRQLSGVKIINSVADTLNETDASFVRINGWTTFLKAPTLEASCRHGHLKKLAEDVFATFHKTLEWLPDEPGFVVPRVVSLIVNEAYFALTEGVSTRDEIDTAMKLGTAYPFGPFEWSKKIGLNNIATLLKKLSNQQIRYTPASLLLKEAGIT
jgi:3-hydroxybutyryl-CoA dehydrogenase